MKRRRFITTTGQTAAATALSPLLPKPDAKPLLEFLTKFQQCDSDLSLLETTFWGSARICALKGGKSPATPSDFADISGYLIDFIPEAARYRAFAAEFEKKKKDDPICHALDDIEMRYQRGMLDLHARIRRDVLERGGISNNQPCSLDVLAKGELPEDAMRDGKPYIHGIRAIRKTIEGVLERRHYQHFAEEHAAFAQVEESYQTKRDELLGKGRDGFYENARGFFQRDAEYLAELCDENGRQLTKLAEGRPELRAHIIREYERLLKQHNLSPEDLPLLKGEYWRDAAQPETTLLRHAVGRATLSSNDHAVNAADTPAPQPSALPAGQTVPALPEPPPTSAVSPIEMEKLWAEKTGGRDAGDNTKDILGR